MRCLVGQHRLADDVPDRENMRHVRPHLPINRDDALIVDRNTGLVGIDTQTVGAPAHRDQEAAEQLWLRRLGPVKRHAQARLFGRDLGHPGAFEDLAIARGYALFQRPNQIRIDSGHQRIGQLHDGYLNAQRVVNACHLQANDAATDNQQRVRQFGQLQRIGRVHDARIIGQPRQSRALRTRRDDALLELDHLLALLAFDAQVVRRQEFAGAPDDADLALLRQPIQAVGQTPDDPVLPFAQCARIDLRRAEADAKLVHRFGFLDDLGGMQQRLGRDATDIETNAPQRRPTFHQRHVQTQIGSAKGRGIASYSGPEHRQFRLDIDPPAEFAGRLSRCDLGFRRGRWFSNCWRIYRRRGILR